MTPTVIHDSRGGRWYANKGKALNIVLPGAALCGALGELSAVPQEVTCKVCLAIRARAA